MAGLVGYICVFVLSIFYHWFVFLQAKNGGFGDHYAIDPKIMMLGIAKFIAVTIVIVFHILAWDALYIWIPLTLFTVLWFVFSLAILTRRITRMDETLSFIGSLAILIGSLIIIVMQFVGTGV